MKNLALELSEIEKQVSALISENAALREKNRVLDCMLTGESLASNERKHQLDKAKEIIKELLDTQSRLDPYRNVFKDRILKAEQFLKGV